MSLTGKSVSFSGSGQAGEAKQREIYLGLARPTPGKNLLLLLLLLRRWLFRGCLALARLVPHWPEVSRTGPFPT